jgi:hypothetical protein
VPIPASTTLGLGGMAPRMLDRGQGLRCVHREEVPSGVMVASSAGSTKFMRILTMKIARRFDGGDDICSMCIRCSLSDKGMTTEARYLSTTGIRSGRGPWKLSLSIIIVKIRDCVVTRIVICVEPDRFLETWPPIKGSRRGWSGTH